MHFHIYATQTEIDEDGKTRTLSVTYSRETAKATGGWIAVLLKERPNTNVDKIVRCEEHYTPEEGIFNCPTLIGRSC